jgi:hypothetical protein
MLYIYNTQKLDFMFDILCMMISLRAEVDATGYEDWKDLSHHIFLLER